ncbi:hypothetical protein COLO4_35011 [Corchorus olitorius]|uniref:F-box domain-containing protein n=1 Tax=Corchorus olitorius TaxID=93759 RepID=A0A1R3GIJ9_9ROSI|nr:hypothetical protein COLO4_35011 [Corchorus olitorius]
MRSGINLPRDILEEILCGLAVKDLLRFRCVSKDCRDLIDSPDFVKLHLSQSLKTNSNRFLIILGSAKSKPYSLDLDSLENAHIKSTDILTDLHVKFPIIGSCNGLIALETNNGDAIVICNPTTRKIRVVPKPPTLPASAEKNLVYYGFGYDPVSDDYKLVALIQRYNKQNQRFDITNITTEIFSLKTGYWRSSFHEAPCFPSLLLKQLIQPIIVNNAWHLIIKHDRSITIVAFDLITERYREDVPLPLLKNFAVMELGGCLSIISERYDINPRRTWYDIWVMKEYGLVESWTKVFSSKCGGNMMSPVAYSKCGQKVLLWITDQNGHKCKLVWYNLKGKRIEDIKNLDVPYFWEIDVCFGSLVSPMYGCSRNEL